jgi:hypothetical protein
MPQVAGTREARIVKFVAFLPQAYHRLMKKQNKKLRRSFAPLREV